MPQVAAALDFIAAVARVSKEAAIGRLYHVIGIEALGQPGRQPAAGQGDQPDGITLEQFRRRLLVPRAQRSTRLPEASSTIIVLCWKEFLAGILPRRLYRKAECARSNRCLEWTAEHRFLLSQTYLAQRTFGNYLQHDRALEIWERPNPRNHAPGGLVRPSHTAG